MPASELAQMEPRTWHSRGYSDYQLVMAPPGFQHMGSLLAEYGPPGQLALNFHHLMAYKACLYEDHKSASTRRLQISRAGHDLFPVLLASVQDY